MCMLKKLIYQKKKKIWVEESKNDKLSEMVFL